MLISIGTYNICDGTLSGGVAISELRLLSDRLFEFVVPVDAVDSVLLDRVNSKTDLTFTVKRTWPDKGTSEAFILQLDTNIPVSGTITLTTTGPSPFTRVIDNGFLVDHELVGEFGSTTFHRYHVVGGPPEATWNAMQCTIGAFALTDGTLPNGWALTNLRLKMERIFDVVIPLGTVNPQLFDRKKRRCDVTFNVQRVQDTIKDAENYINVHEATVPRTGDIKFSTEGPTTSVIGLIINGAIISHELVRQIGKFTEHQYHIVGAPIFAPPPGGDEIITEGGDHITTEGGDRLVTET